MHQSPAFGDWSWKASMSFIKVVKLSNYSWSWNHLWGSHTRMEDF